MALAKLYGRIFVVMGVPFGLFMGIVGVLRRWPGAPLSGLLVGAQFGAAMALILGITAAVRTRGMGSEALRTRHRRVLVLTGSRADVLARMEAAMGALRSGEVRVDTERGVVEAKIGISMWSWGDVLTARLDELGDGRQRVVVESRPRVRFTIVDYGVNAQHIETVVAALSTDVA